MASPPSVASSPSPYNQPYLVREDNAQATLTFRPVKPLKTENSYLFERLRTNRNTFLFEQAQIPHIGQGDL